MRRTAVHKRVIVNLLEKMTVSRKNSCRWWSDLNEFIDEVGMEVELMSHKKKTNDNTQFT